MRRGLADTTSGLTPLSRDCIPESKPESCLHISPFSPSRFSDAFGTIAQCYLKACRSGATCTRLRSHKSLFPMLQKNYISDSHPSVAVAAVWETASHVWPTPMKNLSAHANSPTEVIPHEIQYTTSPIASRSPGYRLTSQRYLLQYCTNFCTHVRANFLSPGWTETT